MQPHHADKTNFSGGGSPQDFLAQCREAGEAGPASRSHRWPTMLKWASVGSLMGDGIWPESL
jgi:hypothetical protein